ncbi:MAG: hypothetical protein H6591_07955 [Flavobacteriales bacterium]|nr:hypothetical protein [Flavobacteriales bacterium]
MKFEGEIRYGPTYNTVHIDGVRFEDVIAGDEARWLSNDLVAVQEWMTTAERFGPNTCLLLIDVTKRVFCRAPVVHKGFVGGFSLSEGRVRYQESRFGWSGLKKVEDVYLNLADIQDWVTLP